MTNSTKAILIETFGLILFVILCNSHWNVPTFFLVGFLVILQVGLIWMTIVILKDVQADKNRNDGPVTFQ